MGYVTGCGLTIWAFAETFVHDGIVLKVLAVPTVGIAVWMFWMCRRGERFIAEACIARYLSDPKTPKLAPLGVPRLAEISGTAEPPRSPPETAMAAHTEAQAAS